MGDPTGSAMRFVLQGGLPLVLARATFVAALLSLGGVLTFRVFVLPRVVAQVTSNGLFKADRMLNRLTWLALGLSLVGAAGWTVLQSAAFAAASSIAELLQAIVPVLSATRFGHLVLLQVAAIGVVAVLLRSSAIRSATAVSLGSAAAQAGHGHAMAMGGVGSLLFWVDVAHLLAASAWIGGLLPLLIVVRLAPFKEAALAARWFSPLGKWCVGTLVGSSMIQGWYLVGSVRALIETPYGWMVLVKTGCFGVLFGLAVLNRFELAPALLGEGASVARRRLVGSVAVQTGTGLLAVVAASVLSGLAPGMDMGSGS